MLDAKSRIVGPLPSNESVFTPTPPNILLSSFRIGSPVYHPEFLGGLPYYRTGSRSSEDPGAQRLQATGDAACEYCDRVDEAGPL
jgi:hypothetical protein